MFPHVKQFNSFLAIKNMRPSGPRKARKTVRFLSLFAGIGGFDLGLERAGMQCVGQVEINPFCQRVLAHHWPHVKRIGDIQDVTESDFGAVDLICGGFPCQPFSQAGKRKGSDDNRYLWPEMLRVIEAYRPAWIIGENVVGIVNMALDTVCADLGKIGYHTQCFIIPACAVNAPHRRDRVWIIANANGLRLQEPRPQFKTSRDRQLVQGRKSWGESWREVASRLCRVGNGIPDRMDRLKSIGNAVVPQVVEVIGRAIMATERAASMPQEVGQKDNIEGVETHLTTAKAQNAANKDC